jgi:hypothetical protein
MLPNIQVEEAYTTATFEVERDDAGPPEWKPEHSLKYYSKKVANTSMAGDEKSFATSEFSELPK